MIVTLENVKIMAVSRLLIDQRRRRSAQNLPTEQWTCVEGRTSSLHYEEEEKQLIFCVA